MKTVIKESFKALFAFSVLSSLTICLAAFANASEHKEGGHGGGNGGDPDERRFREISEDITKWINEGGSAELMFPAGLELQTYIHGMLQFLDPKATTVGFTQDKIFVGPVEKTCKNFFDAKDSNRPNIICNTALFRATPEADQYTLVHHEFAGLAGFEMNFGASSNYTISNQLTEYLTPVLRLGIKKKPHPARSMICEGYSGIGVSKTSGMIMGGFSIDISSAPVQVDLQQPLTQVAMKSDVNSDLILETRFKPTKLSKDCYSVVTAFNLRQVTNQKAFGNTQKQFTIGSGCVPALKNSVTVRVPGANDGTLLITERRFGAIKRLVFLDGLENLL